MKMVDGRERERERERECGMLPLHSMHGYTVDNDNNDDNGTKFQHAIAGGGV